MKAIVATGFGKLHFHETARALAAAGVEVNFLTGWVPKDNQTALVDLLGKFLGEKHLAARMAARQISIPGVSVTPVAWAEVAGTFIKLVQHTRVIPLDLAYGMEFRLAAWGSRKYLRNADVLLVRSGAGQSGAIRRARENGLAIVTDHSIAHPAFMHVALREEFARFGLPAGYDSRADLWKLVLRDCADADMLLVNSDFVKKTFVEQGYPADKVRVAYLGVREEFFDLKRDYRIDGPVRILVYREFRYSQGGAALAGGDPPLPAIGARCSSAVDGKSGQWGVLSRTGRRAILYPHTLRSFEAGRRSICRCGSIRLSHLCRRLIALGDGGRCRWFAYHYDRKLRLAPGAWERVRSTYR